MNTITFEGVGVDTIRTDIGNYRIVSNFKNKNGLNCFVEIAHFEKSEELFGMVRQAYIKEYEAEKHLFSTFDNMYNRTFPFTLEHVLKTVNRLFDCDFTDVNVVTRKDIAEQNQVA